jgi:hypothetical protein
MDSQMHGGSYCGCLTNANHILVWGHFRYWQVQEKAIEMTQMQGALSASQSQAS